MGFEMNRCHICGEQLAPDDFDGICAGCDEIEVDPTDFNDKEQEQ